MPDIEYRRYSPELLDAVVAFWNDEFLDRRNFFPVSAELFEKRVVRGGTRLEKFSPEQIILACSGREVVGIIHALARSETTATALLPDWRGGPQGVIAFFAVARAWRRKGIGAELFLRARAALTGQGRIVIDGQCLCPFWGNSSAPFTPLWGTSEGPSISHDDSETARFLKKQGFSPRYDAITLETDLARARREAERQPEECTIELLVNQTSPGESEEIRNAENGAPFYCCCSQYDGEVVGRIVFFEMREVEQGKGAIYHFEVAESARTGGIGTALLERAIEEMRKLGWQTCETLTVPKISAAGVRLYEKFRFAPAAHWLIY